MFALAPERPEVVAPAGFEPVQLDQPAAVPQATDDERPEATGYGLQLRLMRQMETELDLDLTSWWDDYEDDVREDGETRPFPDYVAQKLRVRRGLGIGVVALGAIMLGSTGFTAWAAHDAFNDGIPIVPGFLVAIAVFTAAGGVTGIAVGARIWTRNKRRLQDLRGGGFITGGPRWRLRAVAPLVHPRGAGLGLSLSF